jgi:hypothetical protein
VTDDPDPAGPPTDPDDPPAQPGGTAARSPTGSDPAQSVRLSTDPAGPSGRVGEIVVVAEPVQADWTHFAPAELRGPSAALAAVRRLSRTAGLPQVGRVLRHEWTVVALAGILLAYLVNDGGLTDLLIRHTVANPLRTLPEDVWDPSLVAYLIAWDGHALLHDPAHLWHLNAFYPASYGLAFTDSLLGYAPLGMIGTGLTAAILRYNLVFLLAHALAFGGPYALFRQLGAGRIGAVVAGVATAVAPWRLGQAGHLHVISTGAMALALAMLARGHGLTLRRSAPAGARRTRPGWILAGWGVAAWQITVGFGVGLVFLYVLLGSVIGAALWWAVSRRPRPDSRVLAMNLVGGGVFAIVAILMARPYLKVLEIYPYAARNGADVTLFSPPLRGYVTSPPESWLWGARHAGSRALLRVPGEMDLLPGFTLYALAAAGLVFSLWSVRARLVILAGIVASIALGLGTHGPAAGRAGYLWLLDHVPGFDGLRTPGRLVVWTTLLLALLAAGGVAELVRRVRTAAPWWGWSPGALARGVAAVPLVLVLAEGLGVVPHPVVPTGPPSLSTVAAPYLVLPSAELSDEHVMLWSTDRFAPVANGTSGFLPTQLAEIRNRTGDFPSQSSVDFLRSLGIRTVVVLPPGLVATIAPTSRWMDAQHLPMKASGVSRTVAPDGSVIFKL